MIASITFTIEPPLIAAVLVFLACIGLGVLVSIQENDGFHVVCGGMVGLGAGLLIFVIVSCAQHTKKQQAIQEQNRQDCITEMPENWQQFHKRLNEIPEIPIKRMYVNKFIKPELEPISEEEFKVIYDSPCNVGVDTCVQFKWWLTEQLMPFVVLD